MASVTIRNLAPEVVTEIKVVAARNGRSLEAELRDLLTRRYRRRSEVLRSIRGRWKDLPKVTASQVDAWIESGRR